MTATDTTTLKGGSVDYGEQQAKGLTPSDNTLVKAMTKALDGKKAHLHPYVAAPLSDEFKTETAKAIIEALYTYSGLTVELIEGIRSGKNIVVNHEAMNNMVRDILQDNKFCMIEALNSPIERREG